MSNISQKCLYGIRALFELSKHWESGELIKLQDIAKAQAIPKRFLENILNQLRQGNFVESRRGKEGGFRLSREPSAISVGDIIRFIDNSLFPVSCISDNPSFTCPLKANCVFIDLWRSALAAIESVYNAKSLQNLVDEAKQRNSAAVSYPLVRKGCEVGLPIVEEPACFSRTEPQL